MNSLQTIPILGLFKNRTYNSKSFWFCCSLIMIVCLLIFQVLPKYHWLKFEIFIGEIQASTGESIRQEFRQKKRLEEYLISNRITDSEMRVEVLELWNLSNFVFIHDVKFSEKIGVTANFTCKYLGIVGNISKHSVELFKQYVVEVLVDGLVREKALVQKQQLEMLLKDIAARNEALDFRISFLERQVATGDVSLSSIEDVDFNKLDRSAFLNLLGESNVSVPRRSIEKLEKIKELKSILSKITPGIESLITQYEQVVNQKENPNISFSVDSMLEVFRVEVRQAVNFGHVIDPLPIFPLLAQILISLFLATTGGILLLIICYFKNRVANGHTFD